MYLVDSLKFKHVNESSGKSISREYYEFRLVSPIKNDCVRRTIDTFIHEEFVSH